MDAPGRRYEVEGLRINVGTTVGGALWLYSGEEPDELVTNADLALYHTEAEGRGTRRFSEPKMDATAKGRRALEDDLREALGPGEFELHYQPLIGARSGAIRDSQVIVRAVLALAGDLGMATTAEDVETQAQAERLRTDGCTELHGYLLSRPVPGPEMARMLSAEAAAEALARVA